MPSRSAIALSLLILASPAAAQQGEIPDSSRVARGGRSGSEVWVGYSPGSTHAGVLGRHGGVRLTVLGVRFNRRVRVSERRSLYYTFDAIPLARVTPLIRYTTSSGNTIPSVFECRPPERDCNRVKGPANGIGINPLGWTAVYGEHQRAQWRLGATAGMMYFDRPTPSDLAARFNFTAAVEGGLQVTNRGGSGVLLVYRLHHLSNAGTASDNLAMLSHIFSIGATWRTR